ncbi:MAG: PQQ-dependent sugar dehydrogenase [Thermomicrobiales bacterium]
MFLSWLCFPRDRRADIHRTRPLCPEPLEDRTLPATLLPGFSESVFASGLTQPTTMAFAPDSRLFVAEKGGNVRVIQNGQLLPTPFLTLSVNSASERGLNGLAFDPDFSTNGFVYVYYTTNESTPVNRLSRFTVSAGNPNLADPNSELVLLDDIASTQGNHNGGALHFGKDGMLYVGVGEAGVPSNSQTLANLSGKILRINPDGGLGNLIPPDNPFVNTPGARGEIFALGYRNPFTFAVDPVTGRIFVNDVGSNVFEEIDNLVAGGNFGWPNAEGFSDNPTFINPVRAYPHGDGASIAGGVFSRNNQYPSVLQDGYFFSDFIQGFIRYLKPNGEVVDFATGVDNPVDLDFGPDGQLYVLSLSTGSVIRLAAMPGVGESRIIAVPSQGVGQVRVFDASGGLRQNFNPYPGYLGSVRVATGDVNGDGFEDYVTATGGGVSAHVKILDGVALAELASFFAYNTGYLGGIEVAVGDIDGDGLADVVTGTDSSAPHVKAFTLKNGVLTEVRSFFAFDPGFAGGVRVAAGDVNGDGKADLIVAAGVGGGGHVKVFDAVSLSELASFLAYGGATLPQGIWVGAGDVDGDGFDEVLTGTGAGTLPHVKAFGIPSLAEKSSFYAFGTFVGGVRVAATDANKDGRDDIIAGVSTGPPHVRVIDGQTEGELASFFAFDPALMTGVFVAGV